MYYYKYEEFTKDVDTFFTKSKEYNPDVILAVARGGVTFGHFLAEKFKIRDLYTLNSIHYDDQKKLDTIDIFNIPYLKPKSRVLIVDDIVDSGDSMYEILKLLKEKYPDTEFKTGSIFYKKSAKFDPDFKLKEAHDWIEFFWSINS
jgi:xanthine phosphoribosyltransferase